MRTLLLLLATCLGLQAQSFWWTNNGAGEAVLMGSGVTNQTINADVRAYLTTIANGATNTSSSRGSMTNGLIAEWPMNELTGDRADVSGNNRTLTQNGTVSYTTGVSGNAANWPSANGANYFSLDDALLKEFTSSMTVSYWFKPGSLVASQAIIGLNGNTDGTRKWLAWLGNDKIKFTVYTNSSLSHATVESGTVTNGGWYWVCGIIDTTNMVCKQRTAIRNLPLNPWVQSSQFAGYGPAGTGTNTTAPLTVGMIGIGVSPLVGAIDGVRIANYALSDIEITNLYSSY